MYARQAGPNVPGRSATILTARLLVCTEFVDEFPELEEIYSVVLGPRTSTGATQTATPPTVSTLPNPRQSATPTSASLQSPLVATSVPWTPGSLQSGTEIVSPPKRRRTNETTSDKGWFDVEGDANSSLYLPPPFQIPTTGFERSQSGHEDAIESLLRAADCCEPLPTGVASFPEGQEKLRPQRGDLHTKSRAWLHGNIQEVCLMRYWIDDLSRWVTIFCRSIGSS